jgi:hypothetical protein
MKRQKILKVLNIFLILAFLTVLVSIALYRWIPSDLRGSMLLYDIHQYSGIAFFVIGGLHLIFNWNWVKNVYFSYFTKKRR